MTHSFSSQLLSVQRGNRRLLDNLGFTLNSGEILRIVGANGSGKTSLLRILAGLSQAESGDILWCDQPITDSETFQHQSCYLGHRDGNKLNLTTLENLRFHQKLLTTYDEDALIRVLNELNLLNQADQPCKQLSFGQKRRLAFARLLIAQRPLWLLDEPFTGVDVDGKALLERLCIDHLNNNGLLILTHHGELENADLKQREQQLELAQFMPEVIA